MNRTDALAELDNTRMAASSTAAKFGLLAERYLNRALDAEAENETLCAIIEQAADIMHAALSDTAPDRDCQKGIVLAWIRRVYAALGEDSGEEKE